MGDRTHVDQLLVGFLDVQHARVKQLFELCDASLVLRRRTMRRGAGVLEFDLELTRVVFRRELAALSLLQLGDDFGEVASCLFVGRFELGLLGGVRLLELCAEENDCDERMEGDAGEERDLPCLSPATSAARASASATELWPNLRRV